MTNTRTTRTGNTASAIGADNAASAPGRLQTVRETIKAAEARFDRPPQSVTLIAVSKTFDVPAIRPVIEAGQRVFGENRVQEASQKWPLLRQEMAAQGDELELHLIGPLQSNKAADAVALFDWIETVDRDKIAKALAAEIARQNRRPTLLVQVNTGDEPQKAGLSPTETDAFLARCRDDYGLEISGLMCIPPFSEPPGPHFALLDKIARRNGLPIVSMGMSGDFETAIQMGATHVRVGSAIFGARSMPK